MNILFINAIDTRGGAPRVAYSLKEELKKRGHSSSLFVKHKYSNDPDVHLMKWPSPLTRLIKKTTGKDIGSVLSGKLHYLLATDIDFFNSDQLLKTEEFKKADIVHCHNLHGNFFKLDTVRKIAKKKPVVWTFHDMWPITAHCGHAYGGAVTDGFFECPNLKTYQELSWDNQKHLIKTKREIYKKTDFHIVVPSLWLQDKVRQSMLADHPLSLIYNGIDHETFVPLIKSEARKNLSIPEDKKVVAFVSAQGYSKEKGSDYLEYVARYFSNQNDFLFLCIGHGGSKAPVNLPNVRFIPFVSDKKTLSAYYSASDMLLFTSLAENFPLVVLEALSSGLPVVSFDVGGVKEAVLHKKHGYIARYKDDVDLVQGILYVASLSEGNSRQMRIAAREQILENFTATQMVAAYIVLYKKALQEFKPVD